MSVRLRRKPSRPRRQGRRRMFAAVVGVLVLAGGVAYGAGYASSGGRDEKEESPPLPRVVRANSGDSPEEPIPEAALKTPEGAAYWAVAPELPRTNPASITGVFRSKLDPSWASVHLRPPGERKPFVVFVEKSGGSWEAKKSIRADEPNYAKNELVPLGVVPKDLVQYIYPENRFAAKVPAPREEKIDAKALPSVEPPEPPAPELVTDGVPGSERGRVEKALREARRRIEAYPGIAGVYVYDLRGDFGYGVRPDEQFFSASIIKVPVMVAVYRDVDRGKLDFSQMVKIEKKDWAAGAGWLQWEKAGTKQTVGDLLGLMMTQSDNVATNALVRLVGGADRVNAVARSLGAKNTLLYQKLSSERAAIPELDNRTTPRDMATMLRKIAEGSAASDKSCRYMIDLMKSNELDWWLDEGLPYGVYAANKGGWLYEVYDDAGIVRAGDRPYVVSIMSKYGTGNVDRGGLLIEELSRTAWKAQNAEGGGS